jgi:hypothetical protein
MPPANLLAGNLPKSRCSEELAPHRLTPLAIAAMIGASIASVLGADRSGVAQAYLTPQDASLVDGDHAQSDKVDTLQRLARRFLCQRES